VLEKKCQYTFGSNYASWWSLSIILPLADLAAKHANKVSHHVSNGR